MLVRWQWKTHEQQFLPRLGAPIHHVAVDSDDSLTAISQKDNSKFLLTIVFTFKYICQLWLDMLPFYKIHVGHLDDHLIFKNGQDLN